VQKTSLKGHAWGWCTTCTPSRLSRLDCWLPRLRKKPGRGRVSQLMCWINYCTVVISRQCISTSRKQAWWSVEVLCFSSWSHLSFHMVSLSLHENNNKKRVISTQLAPWCIHLHGVNYKSQVNTYLDNPLSLSLSRWWMKRSTKDSHICKWSNPSQQMQQMKMHCGQKNNA